MTPPRDNQLDLCHTCGHHRAYHESWDITIGHCGACPERRRCERFVGPRAEPAGEGEGERG